MSTEEPHGASGTEPSDNADDACRMPCCAHITESKNEKIKVVILGAGIGGLATAYGLSATPELRAKYDVRIYTVGGRAGGKCATGRAGETMKIEQDGTHYLFGAYSNTFAMARDCYENLEQKGDGGFGSWSSTFEPCSYVVAREFIEGNWRDWPVRFPTNQSVPGSPGELPQVTDYLQMLAFWCIEVLTNAQVMEALEPPIPFTRGEPRWLFLRTLFGNWVDTLNRVLALLVRVGARKGNSILSIGARQGRRPGLGYQAISLTLSALRCTIRKTLTPFENDNTARRCLVLMELGLTFMIGLINDMALAAGGLASLNRWELRDWLRNHGAAEIALDSAVMKSIYDSIAAYEDGDPDKPMFAAGSAINSLLRAGLTYKGAFAYYMKSEIGDDIIGPIYQALKNRGVRFAFFHRVWEVRPSEDGKYVDEIEVEQQLAVKGCPYSYDPFVDCNGRKVWPSTPNLDQLDLPPGLLPEGLTNKELESFYTAWKGTEPNQVLRRGVDFDVAVFAMQAATMPTYCPRLLEQKPVLTKMLEQLAIVETQALRLWLKPSAKELGWTKPKAILSGYITTFGTWEDNGHQAEWENWPPHAVPQLVASFFGPLPGGSYPPPGPNDHEYPVRRQEETRRNVVDFLTSSIGSLWPKAGEAWNPETLDWWLLADPEERKGIERLEAQYFTANSGPNLGVPISRPTERRFLLRAGESGYRNLYLSGEWVRNGLDTGAVESAVMAGLQASRGICGYPEFVPFELGVLNAFGAYETN